MKRKILFLVFIILALATALIFYLQKNKQPEICLKSNCYFVEIARTQTERERGLMDRNNLGKNEGMLFINEKEGIYPFWMKNVLIPLDIIWFNKSKEVVFMAIGAEPCKDECQLIYPDQNAQYILEVNSGEINRMNLQLGNKAEFNIDRGRASVSLSNLIKL